jgi:hypothetical protein
MNSIENKSFENKNFENKSINKLQLKTKHWAPPYNWHSDEDPAQIKDELDRIFVELNQPVNALKLGILCGKYEVAKKLWINCPLISVFVSSLYMLSICILNSYAIVFLENRDEIYPVIKVLLVVIYIYDIISRIYVLFGILNYDFVESRFMVPLLFGCLLWGLGDPNGILLYIMSFMIIFEKMCKRVYYILLSNLLD